MWILLVRPTHFWLRLGVCALPLAACSAPANTTPSAAPFPAMTTAAFPLQPPTPLNPSVTPKEDLLAFLLNYSQQIQSLPLPVLGQELQVVLQHFKAEDVPKHRLKLVLLHGFAHANQRNDKLALELLDGALQKTEAIDVNLLAYLRFLQRILLERVETERRNQLLYNACEQRLKQERKERVDLLEQRTRLQQKLEALKNIERSLNDRGKPAALDKP
ncbi:MAG: hypothetical protein PHP00_11615 [Thiotrichaceae bacterium]|nr:hypothetical protein [Thiotrichaceae bacterium]